MKLLIHIIEARSLPAMDLNGLSDPYARLQLGKLRSKTKVVKKNLNPYWDEEISFIVGDLSEELTVSVLDEDKYFNDDFLGQVKIPLSKVMDAGNLSLGVQWYQLQPKNKKAKMKDCGEIRLGISLSQKNISGRGTPISYRSCSDELTSSSDKSSELTREPPLSSSSGKAESSPATVIEDSASLEEVKSEAPSFVNRLYQYFTARNAEVASTSTKDIDISEEFQESMMNVEVSESEVTEADSNMTFEELLKAMEAKDQGSEMPANLPGGVLVDQSYVASASDLNSLIFSANSNFLLSLADLQGTTGLQTEPWRLVNEGENLKRVCTYTKAATRLVKAVKATEEQFYLKVDGKAYAVLFSVSTPDVPFGNTFKTEVLFCISPGPELPSNEPSSHLVISWRSNFLESTMMKGMIESGARQGLKESYAQFVDMLSQNVKPVDMKELGSSKEQILASLQTTEESDWKLAFRYFGNFTVVSSVLVALCVALHILLANPSKIQGLEFAGLDLPDSVGELVVCGVLVLQGQRVFNMIGRYMQARKQRGSDHGVKAQGDGWLLTVALIEGGNLAAVDSSGFSDPYVVFTCNCKTKTSSIKFQTADPQWNEIFEFDAMDDPPSMMHIDVYDFDGPFDEAISLGHAEVNFVKSNLSDLADIWIPLQGKLAQACQSRLHLRIFLNNTKGNEVVIEYLTKMEKEVGKKLNVRSPQTNSAFQKIFNLPPEEFLINDFTCHLMRKLPMQGRLFLSPRIIGFYTNLFGHKTKFFFLWEDIEDIQVVSPSFVSMGSPVLMVILRHGRGFDARHGAKSVDKEGRLKFQFQSFVSFNVANRTIMALWKARSLSPEQKVKIVEESEERTLSTEESGSFLGIEDAKMSEVFSSNVPIAINSVMALFEGGPIEQRIMEKVGCVNYDVTRWISIKTDMYQRQVHYKFDKNLSRYGGSVTSTQQKSPLVDKKGWVIEEVMTLEGYPLGDYFDIHIRFNIEDLSPKSKATIVQVSLGISWLKSTKHQKRITKNVMSTSCDRLKEICRQVEKELTAVR